MREALSRVRSSVCLGTRDCLCNVDDLCEPGVIHAGRDVGRLVVVRVEAGKQCGGLDALRRKARVIGSIRDD